MDINYFLLKYAKINIFIVRLRIIINNYNQQHSNMKRGLPEKIAVESKQHRSRII